MTELFKNTGYILLFRPALRGAQLGSAFSLDGSGAGEVPLSGLGHAMSSGDTAVGLPVFCLGDNLLWKDQNYWKKVKPT